VENTLAPVEISPEAPVESAPDKGFSVHLSNFDGPFDLLLQLISRHKLDITEVSLSLVTDEFISFIRRLEESGEGWMLVLGNRSDSPGSQSRPIASQWRDRR
jgi:segregation and condensation protein A